jgi:hypothetical protein
MKIPSPECGAAGRLVSDMKREITLFYSFFAIVHNFSPPLLLGGSAND